MARADRRMPSAVQYSRVLHVLAIGVRGAQNGTTRIGLAELQNDLSGKLIGGILLVPEDRNAKEIKHGVARLVRDSIEELAEHCIGGREPAEVVSLGMSAGSQPNTRSRWTRSA